MSSTLLYIGRFGGSESSAFLRVKNISKLIIGADIKAVICSYDIGLIYILTKESGQIHEIDCSRANNPVSALIENITNNNGFHNVLSCIKKYNPEKIIIYNGTYSITSKVISYAAHHEIDVYADATEWYEFASIKKPSSFVFTHSVDKRIRRLDWKLKGVISISNYFFRYYEKKGVKTIKIPPIVSTNIEGKPVLETVPLRIIYAGSPGTKDLLIPIFEALSSINSSEELVRFDLYGVTEDNIRELWKHMELSKIGIYCHGRVAHQVVISEVRNSNYTVLLRKKQRYALAGYSTKACESMYLGTPVICNDIGGTDSDIIDGKTGFVIKDASEHSVEKILRHALSLSTQEHNEMRRNAMEYAARTYSGETYRDELLRFLGYE